MKKTILFVLLFGLFFSLQLAAQRPGDTSPISDNKTMKGKRMLKKEKRTYKASLALAGKNEKEARKKHKTGTVNRYNAKAKKIKKENKKAKAKVEKDNKLAQAKSKREEKERE